MGDRNARVTVLKSFDQLHKDDRDAVQMILGEYLGDHMRFDDYPDGRRNPYWIDMEGLEASLITYCANVRAAVADESD